MKHGKRRKLKQIILNNYFAVGLCENHKFKMVRVHSLILETFVGQREKGHQGRHLDGNSFNNKRRNLQWGTPKENSADRKKRGTMCYGEDVASSKLTSEQVLAIIYSNSSYLKLANYYSVSVSTINDIMNGSSWRQITKFEPHRRPRHKTRLTEQNVLDIRASSEKQRILAQKYKVHYSLISKIKSYTVHSSKMKES